MINTFKNSFKIKEVRNKIFFTLLLVLIYRLGSFVPVPGFNRDLITQTVSNNTNGILGLLNAITGNALRNGTIFAVGISPYINASIIMQLLTVAIPSLERLSKEGDEGREKINRITRYVTVALAVISSVGIVIAFDNAKALDTGLFNYAGFTLPSWVLFIFTTLILTAGSSICMWLGERITEYGVSNGISMLIFVGIISTFGTIMISTVTTAVNSGNFLSGGGFLLILFLLIVVLVFAFIVFVDKAERKIPVQYAKQIKGNRMYGGQSTHIPIKVNSSGVLPIIFAMAILSLPSMIAGTFFGGRPFDTWLNNNFSSNTWPYILVMSVLILGFAYFYSQITFNPVDVSKNLQQNGGTIPGIRQGRPTADYLTKVVRRITLYGALFLAFIALTPSIMFMFFKDSNTGLYNAMSATGMMIVVSVALEFDKSLEQQIMLRHYKGFLK